MEESNRIYSKRIINDSNKNIVQKVRYNREQLLSQETAKELNTYLNFGVFPTFTDTYVPYYDDNGNLIEHPSAKSGIGTPGVRSIFNRAGTVLVGSSDGSFNVDIEKGETVNQWRISNNVPLMDSPIARQRIRKTSGCSIKELVNASSLGIMGQETYAYSDFMYCKHLGKVSNNYLITLRRFPLPVDDYIGAIGEEENDRINSASKNTSCIGCMVNWIGVSGNEMSNILKYSFNMPFKQEEAEWQDKQNSADENNSILNGIFSTFDRSYQKQYMQGIGGEAFNDTYNSIFGNTMFKLNAGPNKEDILNFRDKNKVYGPVDSIKSTYVRSESGLSFDYKMSLVFEYELRSYNGINPKQAMLDLLSNILNVTYTTGTFWGGGFKGYAAQQSNIFTNLNVFKTHGGAMELIGALIDDANNGWKNFKGLVEGGDFFKRAGQMLNSIGGMILGGLLNKLGRPKKAMYNSLLSPAPIGFWHVTIGNPKKPIISMGNMIITNVTIEHSGPLGLDDFPTGLKVTVELDRGKPRDLRDIEKLYMQGNDRIYSSMSDKVFDMYKNSELYKASRDSKNKVEYKPVYNTATVDLEPTKTTITVKDLNSIKKSLKKYFGTDDTYSIYVPAAEQEYGSSKRPPDKNHQLQQNKKQEFAGSSKRPPRQKPSTAANKNIVNE